jgi:hypothetical protein
MQRVDTAVPGSLTVFPKIFKNKGNILKTVAFEKYFFPLSLNFSGFCSLKIVGKDGNLITSEEIIFSH